MEGQIRAKSTKFPVFYPVTREPGIGSQPTDNRLSVAAGGPPEVGVGDAVYQAAGGDRAADRRGRSGRLFCLSEAAGRAAAADRFPDDNGCCDAHLGVIADVNEMTSQNTVGQTRITLQFGLDRDLGGAGLTEKPE